MAGLDFGRAADLFLGSEKELATALGIEASEVREYRSRPGSAPSAVLAKMAEVLIERGRGMQRVGEMLREREA